jgi:hypothetical protein
LPPLRLICYLPAPAWSKTRQANPGVRSPVISDDDIKAEFTAKKEAQGQAA